MLYHARMGAHGQQIPDMWVSQSRTLSAGKDLLDSCFQVDILVYMCVWIYISINIEQTHNLNTHHIDMYI